jgi:hypothetical protein
MKRLLIPAVILLVVTLACSTQKSQPVTGQPAIGQPVLSQQTTAPSPAGPSPTPTETPPPSGTCANPLYPLVPGYQWIYQVSGEQESEPSKIGLTVEKIEENKATVNALDMATGVITQTIAECDGTAILNYPSMTLDMILSSYLEGEINTEYVSGVFSPSFEDFIANNWALTWDGDYIARGDIRVQDEENQMTVIIKDSPVHLNWNTAENGTPVYETVTVPAGTFENALKVNREMDIDVSLATTLGNFQGTLKIKTIHWFLPYTGLLKTEIESGDLTYMGITFPVTLSGQVELVEFKP